jgi:hypothetical protein
MTKTNAKASSCLPHPLPCNPTLNNKYKYRGELVPSMSFFSGSTTPQCHATPIVAAVLVFFEASLILSGSRH